MTTARQMTDLEIYQAARIEALENQLKIAKDMLTEVLSAMETFNIEVIDPEIVNPKK